ncbi:hypothetical protein SAMN05192553_104426 [Cyclobacterium xiamenense]|uniref:Alpha-galactosidase n=1 Tax=Cyclobacterium xiamenense TaxID=1297121 RepID=A0A1H6ZEE8_9BACT|nr:hypothetical protein [Cyclobacterium xiamenense]SEJ51809.1 hypothetical protein SAMN05192553_104426 [Cyclobacterium xiamenense]
MKISFFVFLICCVGPLFAPAQQAAPIAQKAPLAAESDWLLYRSNQPASVQTTQDGHLVLRNGLVSRTFATAPNGATIGLEHLQTGESFLRSVRPEAAIQLNGIAFDVGGLTGQPIHNYLLPEWIASMKADPGSFKLVSHTVENTKERFAWKKRPEWMPKDMPWPAPGKELVFSYQLDEEAIQVLSERSIADESRKILFGDSFATLHENWKRMESPAHERNSFINEGKAGEIMALAHTAVYAEQPVLPEARVFLAKIDPGTDRSSSWGPGLGLVFSDKVIKVNLRPGDNAIGFYNGQQEQRLPGPESGKPVWLRMEWTKGQLQASWSHDKEDWQAVGTVSQQEAPQQVRIGKMDASGGNTDHSEKGAIGRSKIDEFFMLGEISSNAKDASLASYRYLLGITVNVHYELYDGLPVFSKWITVENRSDRLVTVNSFTSEILAVTEPESTVDSREQWQLPNVTIETDYNFGGMTSENVLRSSIAWKPDPLYKTQVNYERTMPVLLEVSPKYGPEQELNPGASFSSYRVWELLHDSWDRERKGLEHRRMMRSLAPWVTENPILMHVRSADTEAVKKAIDQSAEVGFEMVIMTFGSGFNAEDGRPENLDRLKGLADYAHAKGIALGGYSLLASRRVGGGNDVVMPEGMTPRFGNSPCLESEWGHDYFETLYNLYRTTGLDILEHDGSYPGDVCAATDHPGHKGLADSQWNQYRRISEFYQWARSRGIYLNVPDYYFLTGSNKTGMGYRETNWSLPRAQQEIIERQNIYDGTWTKTPSMGWMFVPLVQYHGGGEAATIEPLKAHLPHYEQRLANLFGAGVQACYRGPQLYDAPETKALVEKWVGFYKKHREVLDADLIHLRRPDGRNWDGILHVNPSGEEKGLLMLYNPLNQEITRTLRVPVYYTGLHEQVQLEDQWGIPKTLSVARDYSLNVEVTIPARGYRYFVLK